MKLLKFYNNFLQEDSIKILEIQLKLSKQKESKVSNPLTDLSHVLSSHINLIPLPYVSFPNSATNSHSFFCSTIYFPTVARSNFLLFSIKKILFPFSPSFLLLATLIFHFIHLSIHVKLTVRNFLQKFSTTAVAVVVSNYGKCCKITSLAAQQ